jgi:TldD protein
MTDLSLNYALNQLLSDTDVDASKLEVILAKSMQKQADYADVYLQYQQHESWSLEEGIVKNGHYHVDSGFGLRVISGSKTGFAYSDEVSLDALVNAQKSITAMVRSNQDRHVLVPAKKVLTPLYACANPLDSIPDTNKVDLLKMLDSKARLMDSRIEQVMLSLTGQYEVVLMANHLGEWVYDVRPLISLWISVIAQDKGRREKGSSGIGGRYGYDVMLADFSADDFVGKAVKQALLNLDSVAAPKGEMPVVLGPGWPGILLHEAVGHGLEGDFNRKQTSAFSGRIGEQVASSQCTVIDDGTIENRRGSLTVDDEGVPTQKTVLIENGILKGYMQDRHNASLMGVESTGNGRRESYASRPLPRMTNTYMLPGAHTPQEIIASVDKGVFAVDFAGGQVDITSGKFVFSMSEAYLIENGKITAPLKGATLIGDGPEVMQHISMVGNDLALDSGIGTCGKDGQSVPVGVGQPTLKIDKVVVGGC